MAHARRSNQVPRRRKTWSDGPGATGRVSFAGDSAAFIGAGSATILPDLTLLRTRGRFHGVLTTGTAGGGFTGAMALGIATAPAFAAGIASVPTPLAEPEWDGWIFWVPFSLTAVLAIASPDSGGVSAHFDYEVDSKAMRKQRVGDTLYCAVEVVEQGTCIAEFSFLSRVLDALP